MWVVSVMLVAIALASLARALSVDRENLVPGDPEAFAAAAAEVLPDDSLVLTKWIYYTPLLYMREEEGLRRDLAVHEVADSPRSFRGEPAGWKDLSLAAHAAGVPVVTNLDAVAALTRWETAPLGNGWFRVFPHPPSEASAGPESNPHPGGPGGLSEPRPR
jgi:hypothetical protein